MRDIEITDELLINITAQVSKKDTLKDILKVLELPMSFIKNEKIIKAYEDGLISFFIIMKVSGYSNELIAKYHSAINQVQCELWELKYKNEIEKELYKHAKSKHNLLSLVSKGVQQQLHSKSDKAVKENINDVVEKLQKGDVNDILHILVGNTFQLQASSNEVSKLLTKNKTELVQVEALTKLQVQLMNATRKNIIAINDICNPKKATFIKEANQYNNLQIEEKNSKNKNELQNGKKLLENNFKTTDEGINVVQAMKMMK